MILSLVFRALFNYRVSKELRKYSFHGILLLLIFEGNVEQFAYYFFWECKNLFSATFAHKMGRVFMLFFFFLLLIFSVGGLTLFWFHYKKKVKYLIDDCKKVTLSRILLESLEKSIFPCLFGAVHAMLYEHFICQTIIIGVIEIGYALTKIYCFKLTIIENKFKVSILFLTSALRFVFIVTLFLFESTNQSEVINTIHINWVWLYIACWGI